MSKPDISTASDPDLRASWDALQRAGALARQTAVQTNTSIVVIQNGRVVHISASELRTEDTNNKTASKHQSLASHAPNPLKGSVVLEKDILSPLSDEWDAEG
ncbi:MAG: hypothetical protein ACFCBW_03560 [Candidatus Competibacterales bacterium]